MSVIQFITWKYERCLFPRDSMFPGTNYRQCQRFFFFLVSHISVRTGYLTQHWSYVFRKRCLYWSDSSLLDIRQEWRYLGNFSWRGTNMGILWNRYYFHTTAPLNMVPGKVRHFRRPFTNDIFSFRALSHFCLVKNSLHSHMSSFKELLFERSFALIICELASNWSSVERHNGVILQTKFLEYKDVTALNDPTNIKRWHLSRDSLLRVWLRLIDLHFSLAGLK